MLIDCKYLVFLHFLGLLIRTAPNTVSKAVGSANNGMVVGTPIILHWKVAPRTGNEA